MPRFKRRYLWFYLLLYEEKVMLSWAISYRLYYLLFYIQLSRGPRLRWGGRLFLGFTWWTPLSQLAFVGLHLVLETHILCSKTLAINTFLRLKDKFFFYSGNCVLVCLASGLQFLFSKYIALHSCTACCTFTKTPLFYRVSPNSL